MIRCSYTFPSDTQDKRPNIKDTSVFLGTKLIKDMLLRDMIRSLHVSLIITRENNLTMT